MTDASDGPAREAAIAHVLRRVHPDRRSAEVVDSAPVEDGTLFGVKVHPQGYISQAKYALVVVGDEGDVLRSEACDRRELQNRIETARDDYSQ